MNELMDKLEQVKEALDQTEVVQEVKKINEEVMKDKELLEKIEKYQRSQDPSIKEEILKNKIFRDYKQKETNLNLLILEINQRLKEIEIERKECR